MNSSVRKRAVITGASSGIGRACALRFAADQYDVCINARREQRLTELLSQMQPGHHLICPGDYSDVWTAARLEQLLEKHWQTVDVLVNCAGIFKAAAAVNSPLQKWREPLDTMLNGAVLMTRTVAPRMRAGARIIHVTSIHGTRAEANASAYAMAKAAINQFCRGLAVELADRGILVNAIAPGFIDTEMSIRPDGVNELDTDWFKQNYVQGHHLPLKRAGRPEEIAGVAAFLAGPDSTYMTGQILTVDGGLTITF